MYVYIHVYKSIHIHIYVRVYAYLCVYINIYVYAYMYTYMYQYTRRCVFYVYIFSSERPQIGAYAMHNSLEGHAKGNES